MKKAWAVVTSIVLVVVLLGTVSVGVGLITGASPDRIFTMLDNRFNLTFYYDYFTQQVIPAFQAVGLFL